MRKVSQEARDIAEHAADRTKTALVDALALVDSPEDKEYVSFRVLVSALACAGAMRAISLEEFEESPEASCLVVWEQIKREVLER